MPQINYAAVNDNEEITYPPAEQELATPVVPNKLSNTIIRHMDNMSKTFSKHNFETKAVRKGEVLCITIPAEKIFDANSTELNSEASIILNSFTLLVKRPELYKLVILGHTDDTGDELYSDNLSDVRANAIDEYFENLLDNNVTPNIIPYGMGAEEPKVKNDSIANRRTNRRIEIYIIPAQGLIDMAKAGKLT